MRIAVQESLLPGGTVRERFEHARALGIQGVEVMADDLTTRVPEIAEAALETGIQIAAVYMHRRDGYISPQPAEREAAISALRQAMADAVDLGAGHVVFVPHYGPTRMPDLTPYRAPVELEAEMMIWLLRTVSDLAYALDIELDMLPVNRYESYFMNRLEHAVRFRDRIKAHPHIRIAANLFHLTMEERDWLAALQQHLPHIGYIQLAEQNCLLPGQGMLDFSALAQVLSGYEGWLTCTCRDSALADLESSLNYLRQAGFNWMTGTEGTHG